MKKFLPKNPLAAAGVGVLVGAGITGFKMWNQYRNGAVSKKDAVAAVIRQGVVFGGVAAASTFVGGQGGGGVGLATMSALGLGGSAGAGGMMRGQGAGMMRGHGGGPGRPQQGDSGDLLDSFADTVAEAIVSRVDEQSPQSMDASTAIKTTQPKDSKES